MVEQIVVNLKDDMNRRVLALTERSCEFEKGLSDPEKIINLTPFVLAKREVSELILRAEFVECRL